MWTKTVLVLLAIVAAVHADIYMHNPRGSNNRLNENNNNRANANRLFDSQNNNRGGYNVGDSNAAAPGDGLGQLVYYKTSILRIEWTNQHGATNDNVNTQVVLQYTCSDMSTSLWDQSPLRDGTTTTRITAEGQTDRGRHEPVLYHTHCDTRERNKGLFIAGRNLNGDTARYTRQNSGGTEFGTECTEERDYYPYWHPTPWKDIAVLTHNTTHCDMYLAESQNVMTKSHCSDPAFNNQVDCQAATPAGTWIEEPSWGIDAPVCEQLGWTRDNHLGNTIGGETLNYNWTIPADITTGSNCVLRIRYNISTDDYDPWGTFYEVDEEGDEVTYITNDPNINILKGTGRVAGVQINVDTSQFGRTFEDRSHVFIVEDRPTSIPAEAKIYNLNVRGRRGNIVETYPSVEYDFVPRDLTITPADYVHIQWTGSLSTPNGAGQGTASTDKSNIVCIDKPGSSVPLAFGDPACNLFTTFADHERFATAGFGPGVNELLNDAPATYNGGLIQPGGGLPGDYYYMSTRNNHFSNREHKGSITVTA